MPGLSLRDTVWAAGHPENPWRLSRCFRHRGPNHSGPTGEGHPHRHSGHSVPGAAGCRKGLPPTQLVRPGHRRPNTSGAYMPALTRYSPGRASHTHRVNRSRHDRWHPGRRKGHARHRCCCHNWDGDGRPLCVTPLWLRRMRKAAARGGRRSILLLCFVVLLLEIGEHGTSRFQVVRHGLFGRRACGRLLRRRRRCALGRRLCRRRCLRARR